jgi:hypothetical protein
VAKVRGGARHFSVSKPEPTRKPKPQRERTWGTPTQYVFPSLLHLMVADWSDITIFRTQSERRELDDDLLEREFDEELYEREPVRSMGKVRGGARHFSVSKPKPTSKPKPQRERTWGTPTQYVFPSLFTSYGCRLV